MVVVKIVVVHVAGSVSGQIRRRHLCTGYANTRTVVVVIVVEVMVVEVVLATAVVVLTTAVVVLT